MRKPKFRIPYHRLCPKCKEILEQTRKEYNRFCDRIRKANKKQKPA